MPRVGRRAGISGSDGRHGRGAECAIGVGVAVAVAVERPSAVASKGIAVLEVEFAGVGGGRVAEAVSQAVDIECIQAERST